MSLTTSSIVTNMLSMNSARQLGIVTDRKAKSTEKLSSGYKINRAADDAANLAISEKMRRQIRGLNQGANNIQEGISLCRVADGALAEIHDMLHRGTELSVKAANGTLSEQDRKFLDDEVNQLLSEMEQTKDRVTFNGIPVLKAGEGYGNYKCVRQTFLVPYPVEDVPDREYAKLFYHTNMIGNVDGVPSWVTQTDAGRTFDFSALDEGSNKLSLYDTAISFGSLGPDQQYSFFFGSKPDEVIESFVTEGSYTFDMTHTIFRINIDDVNTGEDLVKKIKEVVGDRLDSGSGLSLSFSGDTITNNGTINDLHRGAMFYGEEMDDVNLYDIRIQAGPENKDCIDFRLPVLPDFNDLKSKIDLVDEISVWKEVWPYQNENGEWKSIRKVKLSNIDAFKETMQIISRERSRIGAVQNRLEHSYLNNLNTAENTTAAESQIRDTDIAKEMVANAKENILQQAGQTILAQANQSRQGLLNLLG